MLIGHTSHSSKVACAFLYIAEQNLAVETCLKIQARTRQRVVLQRQITTRSRIGACVQATSETLRKQLVADARFIGGSDQSLIEPLKR